MNCRSWLLALLGGGLLLRLAILLADPSSFDADNFRRAVDILAGHGLKSYSILDQAVPHTYPYPPLFLGWVALVDGADGLMRIPGILADLILAWLVHRTLERRGVAPRLCLAGAALIAFGPQVWDTSAVQGQIDSLAILPAFVGALLWESNVDRRAIMAGLLIGLGAATKLPAALVVIGLVPTALTAREAVVLLCSAASVPVVALAPFFLADPAGVLTAITYHGYPGLAGYAVIVPDAWVPALFDLSAPLVITALLVMATALVRLKLKSMPAVALVFLTVYVFGVAWSVQYLVWILPFLIVCGAIGSVLAMQVIALGLMLRLAATNFSPLADVYRFAGGAIEAITMSGLYLLWIVTSVSVIRRAGHRVSHP